MGARVNERVLFDIDRFGKDIGARVTYDRNPSPVEVVFELDAVDRFVGGVVYVGGVRGKIKLFGGGDDREICGMTAVYLASSRVSASLGDGLFAPLACNDVIGRNIVTEEVHRDHRELRRGTTLEKQDPVVVGNSYQAPQAPFGTVQDLFEMRRAVADLHHAHPGAAERKQFILSPFQNRFGEHCGA